MELYENQVYNVLLVFSSFRAASVSNALTVFFDLFSPITSVFSPGGTDLYRRVKRSS